MKGFFARIKNAIPHTGKKIKDASVENVRTVAEVTARTTAAVAGRMQEISSDTLDVLTRKSTDDAVREYMLIQSRYNDILALKLDEALKRIEALEKRRGKK